MTGQPHPAGRVPGAVSELVKNALTLAEGKSRPLRRDVRHAIQRELLTALRPMLGQLAAETARLRTELEIRSQVYGYVRDAAKDTAAAHASARHWERRAWGAIVQARREHRRAERLAVLLREALATGLCGEGACSGVYGPCVLSRRVAAELDGPSPPADAPVAGADALVAPVSDPPVTPVGGSS